MDLLAEHRDRSATDGVAGGESGYGNGVDVDGPVNLDVTISQNTVKNSAR